METDVITDKDTGNTVLPPLKAIRAYCLDCCCGSSREVSLCPAVKCPIYHYRSGRRDGGNSPSTLKSIRLKCVDCSCGSLKNVDDCWNTDCPLYPFRMGKNPNRAGIGGNADALHTWRKSREGQVSTADFEVERDVPL